MVLNVLAIELGAMKLILITIVYNMKGSCYLHWKVKWFNYMGAFLFYKCVTYIGRKE